MKRTIKLDFEQWNRIYQSIAREYPHSVLLIRSEMKRVLGFTSRRHRTWIDKYEAEDEFGATFAQGYWNECMVLDFFDDRKQTMFLLKYSEYLNDNTR